MALRVALKKLRMMFDLLPHPLNVRLRLWALHLVLRKICALAARQQRLCDLAPVAVHHVRFVELDLEEEGRTRGVRRRVGVGLSVRGRRADGRADDEAFERLAVPRAAAADVLRKRFYFGYGR